MSVFPRVTIAMLALLWATLPQPAYAETTCELSGCTFTITIKMVAVGGTQELIDNWIDDIESVWNGPVIGDGDNPTHGDCECPVNVDVNFGGWVPDCSNPAANGYHCVEVTPGYARDSSNKHYRAYMRGVSNKGSSITGWWSSTWVNAPAWVGPGEGKQGPPVPYEDVHDAAHEAGHMMELEDLDPPEANIMGMTWGNAARPTQAQIDQIVENNCQDECPDECCCGNGKIEGDKGEECDPNADPNGCEEGEWCIDCECFNPEDPCGNGTVDEEEECDPEAEPAGCDEGETCNEDCVCEPIPPPTTQITSPNDGGSAAAPTTVIASAESPLGIERVSFLLDGVLQEDDFEAPYEWVLDPVSYSPGTHEVRVVAYDLAAQTAEDAIQVDVEPILSVQITEPEPDTFITTETMVTAAVISNAGVEFVTFFVDTIPQEQVLAAPYEWIFAPAAYPPPGPHEIRVEAQDLSGGSAADAILVIVDLP